MSERADMSVDDARPRRGCVPVALGSLLVMVGIPMLICPGPGVAVIGAGLGMIATGFGLSLKKRAPSQTEEP